MASEWDDWLNEKPALKPWEDPLNSAYMDGIRTEEDYLNMSKVMMQCVGCTKWSEQELNTKSACPHCGSTSFDIHSTTSLRSFNPITAARRKIKRRK
jgi:predicted RNA-binding Zn-ribbon protein involved in translation (DUF1610 family)